MTNAGARLAAAFLAAAALIGCSKAPEPAGDDAGPANPVVGRSGAGKAAFNEEKAIGRVYEAGYTDISEMTPDAKGVWRGQATRNGKRVAVSVGAQGPVVAE